MSAAQRFADSYEIIYIYSGIFQAWQARLAGGGYHIYIKRARRIPGQVVSGLWYVKVLESVEGCTKNAHSKKRAQIFPQ
jgi:hypothetical protein